MAEEKNKQEPLVEDENCRDEPCSSNDLQELTPEEQLQAELAEQKEQYLRLAAEYDNFRRRSAKERESLTRLVKCDTVADLLPVVDNLKRALDSGSGGDDLRKGLELTMQQLELCLEGLGVTAFGETGEEFDPNLHDAMQHIESADFGENTIADIFQQGYKIGESVIRHAAVVVAN